MRTSRTAVWISGLNLALFLITWVVQSLSKTPSGWVHWLYFVSGLVGLLLAIYGFVTLAKGGDKNVRPAGLLILLTFIPGCAVLIEVLKIVGGHPV